MSHQPALRRLGFITHVARNGNGGLSAAAGARGNSGRQGFRLFEGGLPLAECFDRAANTCPLSSCCRLNTSIARALEAFFRELDGVTLADLVAGNAGLSRLLLVDAADLA